VGAPVVAGGDAPPILQLGEKVFYLVALAIELLPVLWTAG
jgi:hypothetical protein